MNDVSHTDCLVLTALTEYPSGLTDSEIAGLLGLSTKAVQERLAHLVEIGFIQPSGRRSES